MRDRASSSTHSFALAQTEKEKKPQPNQAECIQAYACYEQHVRPYSLTATVAALHKATMQKTKRKE